MEKRGEVTQHKRLAVLNAIVGTGLVPVFYNGDAETAIKIVAAWGRGRPAIEFTNRGDFAPQVFTVVASTSRRPTRR